MRKGRRPVASSSYLRHSDDQNSSDQELKFIYVTRATHRYQNQEVSLKILEVGVLPTLVYCFSFWTMFKGTCWRLFSELFRTDLSVVWIEKSRLSKAWLAGWWLVFVV